MRKKIKQNTTPEIDITHNELMKQFVIDSDLYREAVLSNIEKVCGGNLNKDKSRENYYGNLYEASCEMERKLSKLQKDIDGVKLRKKI